MASEPRFQRGDNVRIISSGKIGTINDVLIRGEVAYKVTVDGKAKTYQDKYLEPFVDEEQEVLTALALGEYGTAEDFLSFQTWYRLKRPIETNLYSYLASRTTFNPYQFKPLLKFLSAGSEERLFIADEVGVGKTIETGIVLTELLGRGRLDRRSHVLVVCPNVLGPKWQREMERRFGFHFTLLDGRGLRTYLNGAINGAVPEGMQWSIVGLQLLRHRNNVDLLERLDAMRQHPFWSMTVVDEAHHMRNQTTLSNEVGNILSGLSDMMIMLSATPLNLRDADLFHQMRILNPSMFPDEQTFQAMLSPLKGINRVRSRLVEPNCEPEAVLQELDNLLAGPLGDAFSAHPGIRELKNKLVRGTRLFPAEVAQYDRMLMTLSPLDSSFTRTLKREALGHPVIREAVKVPVRLTPEEAKFYEDVMEALSNAYLERGGSPSAFGFVLNMPQRMLSSSIPAMRDYLNWCLENDQMLIEGSRTEDDPDDDADLQTAKLPDYLRQEFLRLASEAQSLTSFDSKYEAFKGLLDGLLPTLPNQQVVVFSFFIRTLKYLQRRLTEDGYRVGVIHGGVPLVSDGSQPGRYDIIDSFQHKELDILLSSEVGGEGLDFQFCQAIVNYDLPYNPMRVEQRIGRIDRFGQTADKIVAASMYLERSIDERIYELLYERIRLVEDSIGMMEPILGSELLNLQNEIVSGKLTEGQIAQRMQQLQLAIEQAAMEQERFENDRRELMGDDSFLSSPLHSLDQQNDFVTPADAMRLTTIILSQKRGSSFRAVDDDRGIFQLSKELRAELDTYMRQPGSEGSFSELKPLIESTTAIPVIFNGNIADRFDDHVFLPPTGFWVRFLLKELERTSLQKTFRIRDSALTEEGFMPGTYVIPFFEIKLEGFRTELNLAAVPVHVTSGQPVESDFQRFSRLLTANTHAESWSPVEFDANECIDVAREALQQKMEERMETLRSEHQFRMESRIGSLERGSHVRIERLMQKLKTHEQNVAEQGRTRSEEFERLVEAQIVSEVERTMAKVERLRNQQELSFSISLVAAAVLEV